jgi:hypothetical protein
MLRHDRRHLFSRNGTEKPHLSAKWGASGAQRGEIRTVSRHGQDEWQPAQSIENARQP